MDNILGLDLGTNSIGWAFRNPLLQENQIEKFGVLTFNKGVGKDKTGEFSYAAERTKKRSTRRLYQARKYRLWATLDVLITLGYCPLSVEGLNKWRKYSKEEARKNKNGGRAYPIEDKPFDAWIKLDFDNDGQPDYTSPYQLRRELTEQPFDLENETNRFKLGRALYHIAQRRGFKSSRKGADDLKEKEGNEDLEIDLQYSEKKKNKEIQNLFEKHPEAKTIGALFAILENNGIRIRESIQQYAIRENFKEEIKHIFQFQNIPFTSELYTKLVESGKNKNDGSIFYKRPLRSQKGLVGKCTLELNKYRAPVSHPSFEKFRAWCFLNNIKYKPEGDKGASWSPLPLSLKEEIYAKLFFRKKAYFLFSEIAEHIKKSGKKWDLNYKPKTTVTGCPVSARLREIWGDDFENIRIPKSPSEKVKKDYYDLEDIWHVLFSFEDQEYIVSFAQEKLKLDEKNTIEFVRAWNDTPVGYAMLSLNAINKINVFLLQGLIYTEAVLLANLPEVIGSDLYQANKDMFVRNIGDVIQENRNQKTILNIVNNLIAHHKNLPDQERFGYKNNEYKLDESDEKDIHELIIEQIGKNTWETKPQEEKTILFNTVKSCYQAYFKTTGFETKFIKDEKYFVVKPDSNTYYKTESGFYRLPKLIDSLADFLVGNFNIDEKQLAKIYHPSEIEIYPKAKEDKKDGIIKLGSPKTGSFKNPMAMRALHELRKLTNYLIETKQIDSDTGVVVEVARELNDANKRWAIETWQKRREEENQEFANAIAELLEQEHGVIANPDNQEDREKLRLWYEQSQSESETLPPITEDKKDIKGLNWNSTKRDSYKEIQTQKNRIDKYRLWKEQDCQCIYTGKIIKMTDLFGDNVIDFEHTIPRSISFDNSLANLTVCYADYNRNIKKNNIPYNLPNYDKDAGGYTAILPRLEKWKEKVERIKQQIEFWRTKSKRANTKENKDKAIRERHLWQMELDYWQNKVERFTITEITSGFKNSQKVDTQLISKYAFHYLKSYFERVDVQKGSITADFRKMYELQVADEKKDRSKHSHHAKDAAVLTLIPVASKRDSLLEQYYLHKEQRRKFEPEPPFKGFKRELIWNIDDNILIHNIAKNQALTPAKRKGKKEFLQDENGNYVYKIDSEGNIIYKKHKDGKPIFKNDKEGNLIKDNLGNLVPIPIKAYKRKAATGDCIRGQLHGETFFGAIRLGKKDANGRLLKDENDNFIQSEETKYVLRVNLKFKKSDSDNEGVFKKEEELDAIVDKHLLAQIKRQISEVYNGSFKDALENGVYMLDKKGNQVNRIRHVRIFKSVKEPLAIKKHTYLSKYDYKQHYYATNATNSYFALYEGNGKKYFAFRNLYEIAGFISTIETKKQDQLFTPSIFFPVGKKNFELQLKYVLKTGMKLLFLKDVESTEDIKNLNDSTLSKRLYVYNRYKKNGESSAKLFLKHHLEARDEDVIDAELKARFQQKDAEVSILDFENIIPKVALTYSKYNFLVEGYDFKIEMDGSIKWLKKIG